MGLEGLKRFRMRAHRHEALYELSSRVFMWIWGLGSRASGFGMRLGGIWDWALGFWGSVFFRLVFECFGNSGSVEL